MSSVASSDTNTDDTDAGSLARRGSSAVVLLRMQADNQTIVFILARTRNQLLPKRLHAVRV